MITEESSLSTSLQALCSDGLSLLSSAEELQHIRKAKSFSEKLKQIRKVKQISEKLNKIAEKLNKYTYLGLHVQ